MLYGLVLALGIVGISHGAGWQAHADSNHNDYTKPQLTRGRISFLKLEDAQEHDHKAMDWRPSTPRPTRLSLEQIENEPIEEISPTTPPPSNALVRARRMSEEWQRISRTVSGQNIRDLVLPTRNERLSQSSVASLSSLESPVSDDEVTKSEEYHDEDL